MRSGAIAIAIAISPACASGVRAPAPDDVLASRSDPSLRSVDDGLNADKCERYPEADRCSAEIVAGRIPSGQEGDGERAAPSERAKAASAAGDERAKAGLGDAPPPPEPATATAPADERAASGPPADTSAELRARTRRSRDDDVCSRPTWPEGGIIARPPVYWVEHRKLVIDGSLEHDRLLVDLLTHTDELTECHRRGVNQRLPPGDQRIRGRAAITLRIDERGRVVDSRVRFADECVRVCIVRSSMAWSVTRWDAVEPGASDEITWHVSLGVVPDRSRAQYY